MRKTSTQMGIRLEARLGRVTRPHRQRPAHKPRSCAQIGIQVKTKSMTNIYYQIMFSCPNLSMMYPSLPKVTSTIGVLFDCWSLPCSSWFPIQTLHLTCVREKTQEEETVSKSGRLSELVVIVVFGFRTIGVIFHIAKACEKIGT